MNIPITVYETIADNSALNAFSGMYVEIEGEGVYEGANLENIGGQLYIKYVLKPKSAEPIIGHDEGGFYTDSGYVIEGGDCE